MLITDDPHLKGNSMILEVLADRTGLDQFEVHFATPKLWGFHHDWILKVTHHPKLDVAWSPNIATLYPQLEASWWVCHTTYHLNSFKLYMSQVYDTYYNMYIYIYIYNTHTIYIYSYTIFIYIWDDRHCVPKERPVRRFFCCVFVVATVWAIPVVAGSCLGWIQWFEELWS